MMPMILLVVFSLSSNYAIAQAPRQESTNELKKVVYSGNAADFQQAIWNTWIIATVPVPEITFSNMPDVSVYGYSADLASFYPSGWRKIDDQALLAEGACYLPWKNQSESSPRFTQFKIVVTYETPVNVDKVDPPKLEAIYVNAEMVLSFQSALGRTYTIEYNRGLDSTGVWMALTNVVGTGRMLSITDTNTASQRFYRAKVVLE